MSTSIAVEVENRYYVELLRLDEQKENTLHLTTVEEEQNVALVKLFLFEDNKKHLLHTVRIDPLPRRTGKPNIDMQGKRSGRTRVDYTLFLNGRRYTTGTLDIRKYVGTGIGKWLGIAAAAGAVIVLLWLLLGRGLLPGAGERVAGVSGERGGAATEEAGEVSGEQVTEETAEPQREPGEGAAEEEPGAQAVTRETGAGAGTQSGAEETGQGARESAGGAAEEETGEAAGGTEAEGPTAPPREPSSEEPTPQEPVREEPATEEPSSEAAAAAPQEREWTVYFNPDNAALTSNARDELATIAEFLKDHPRASVSIEGHCALYGTEQGRLDLSKDRARNVYQFLLQNTWSPEEKPEIEWFGAKQYVTRDRERQHLNRRVEIEITY
jgi:outer membrane protein OmpA-like peptidoglycan-associated protein